MTFNIGWWACAMGPTRGLPWLGPALLPAAAGLHIYFAPVPKGESYFLAALALLGFTVDSALLHAGLFSTIGGESFAPLWLVTMWVLFGITFESMLMMRRNRWLLLLSAGLSGPLSYYCAEAVEALKYARPLWASLLIHGALWAVLMPILFRIRDFMIAESLPPVTGRPELVLVKAPVEEEPARQAATSGRDRP